MVQMQDEKEKQKVFKFYYNGSNQIRCVRESEENKKCGILYEYSQWFVIISGVLACVGWWLIWE